MSKLYLLTQKENNGYDTYDSFVVCADSEEEARFTSPSKHDFWHKGAWYFKFSDGHIEDYPSGGHTWTHPSKVKVQYLGEAAESVKKGIVCASFNAG